MRDIHLQPRWGRMLLFSFAILHDLPGYIQTPSWHPFARPFAGTTQGVATVEAPTDHWTMVSVVYHYLIVMQHLVSVEMGTVSKDGKTHHREWRITRTSVSPGVQLLKDFADFRIKFLNVAGYFFNGVRVLFSFHQPSSSPQRRLDGLWNCSVPHWPGFHQHFVCNLKTECAGREDEMWCPDISCQHGGWRLNKRCYTVHRLSKGRNTWIHANTACTHRGAALTSFPTVNDWYYLAVLSQLKGHDGNIFIALMSPDAGVPRMYRYSFQWYNGSISHYNHFYTAGFPPYCLRLSSSSLWAMSCNFDNPMKIQLALCQAESSYVDKTSHRSGSRENSLRGTTKKQTQLHARNPVGKSLPFPCTLCPNQHWTQEFLAYDAFSECRHEDGDRPGDANVTANSSLKSARGDIDFMPFDALFSCQTGTSFVPYSLVCNHQQDCTDNSDEEFCVFPPCSKASQFKCANGQCLQLRHHCDDLVQCVDESDEVDCLARSFKEESTVRPRPPLQADFDGRGYMVYVPLATVREDTTWACPETHVFCPGDGYCLPVYVRCNDIYDCPGREDEVGCDSYMCPGFYRCRGLLNICLHPDHLCDGWPQCRQHDDEVFCNMTCPADCTCLGHAFTCTGNVHVEFFSLLRFLDASGTGLEPKRLVNNQMLVYLSLARCGLFHLGNLSLPNLLSLDLSDNWFSTVRFAELYRLANLQYLYLARNPLTELFSRNSSSDSLENVLRVDLTGVQIKQLDASSDLPFPGLLNLNLSGSGVTHLVGGGFRSFTSLRILDLRGCPMTVFPARIFEGLSDLRLVFAVNYKLCCAANLPRGFNADNCHAPFDEISSCDALLRADVYRVSLAVLAVLALSGNAGCFCLRAFSLTGRAKTGFNVFVTHLCVSDFVMGVYMAMIGVADRFYLGSYLWEDGRWRHSAACQVAGVLALLSSEVSALIICLITLDRFLVIRFPFSRLRFSSFSAQVVSVMMWVGGVVLVTVPFLQVKAYGQFYGQTGICVPLPITRSDFAGRHYAFGVMILLNLVVFLLIAAGQISVYLAMTSNAMSSIDTTRKSRDLIVARRLITVVVSDFLCWFPLGLVGLLAVQGVPVPGEVNVAMAIFVLPLNSALNPFLYTLNVIQEKRQRAVETKLLKLIIDRGINDDDEHANKM